MVKIKKLPTVVACFQYQVRPMDPPFVEKAQLELVEAYEIEPDEMGKPMAVKNKKWQEIHGLILLKLAMYVSSKLN